METASTEGSVSAAETASTPDAAQVADTAQVTEEKQPITPMLKKYKLKVDGEDREREIDLNDEASIVKMLQMAEAAEKRMSESKLEKRKAMDLVTAFENDPEKFLKMLGPKGFEAAEKIIWEKIQEEGLSEEQRELRDLRALKESVEKEKLTKKEQEQKAVMEKMEYEHAQRFQNKFIEAAQKSGIPVTPAVIKRMAELERKNLSYGLEMDAEMLAREVRDEQASIAMALVKGMSPDKAEELLGKEFFNMLRKYDLQKLTEKNAQVYQRNGTKVESSAPKKESKPITIEQWKEQVARNLK